MLEKRIQELEEKVEYLKRANNSLWSGICMKCGLCYSGPDFNKVQQTDVDDDGVVFMVCCRCMPFDGCLTEEELAASHDLVVLPGYANR